MRALRPSVDPAETPRRGALDFVYSSRPKPTPELASTVAFSYSFLFPTQNHQDSAFS